MGWFRGGFILTAGLTVLAWLTGRRRTADIAALFSYALFQRWRETRLAGKVQAILAVTKNPARTAVE